MNINDSPLPEAIRNLEDDAWLQLLKRSINSRFVEGVQFPEFPPENVQSNFVGTVNEETLREAYPFYVLVKDYAHMLGKPLTLSSRFLDFGCGWGRYMRFFWKDLHPKNMYGCDVDKFIISVCKSTNVPGIYNIIDSKGKLPYPDNFFDVIIAYSVFTHLPEDVHLHWVKELARVARPGCVFCLTLESRRLLELIPTIPDDTDFFWYKLLAKFKPKVDEFINDFDNGKFIFMQTNTEPEAQGIYGDTVVPLTYIRQKWDKFFETVSYIDDPYRFFQAVLIVRRKKIS
jgi:SAM-dependent methyltransferase